MPSGAQWIQLLDKIWNVYLPKLSPKSQMNLEKDKKFMKMCLAKLLFF